MRPNRPSEEFLTKIGIFYLPENVDITFCDKFGTLDRVRKEWVSPRAFVVSKVDNNGHAVKNALVSAFETAVRTKKAIWEELKNLLVDHFSAIPIQHRLVSNLKETVISKPSEEFLKRVGVGHLPPNVKIFFRDAYYECGRAFIIRKLAEDGSMIFEAMVPARDTAAHNAISIWNEVGDTLIKRFGARPSMKPI
jgi:hypothetical protein